MNDNQLQQFFIMQDDIKYMKEDIAEIKSSLSDFIKCADRKYSPMAAWSVLKWLGVTIGVILVGATVAIILSHGFPMT